MRKDIDRLYHLLPGVHRERDELAGEPLRALLAVIAEQVDVVEQDIEQLYENWFIETCDDWVVPYIGDLLGYRVLEAAEGGRGCCGPEQGPGRHRLVPRRDVANTIAYRRRKGSVALLDDLATSVAGWPSRVVEFDRLLSGTQSIRYPRLTQGRTADVRDASTMGRIGSAFDTTAHGVDVRRPQSAQSRGRYNLPNVGLFIWRLRSFPVTRMPANCIDRSEKACYTFSVLGNDCPLFMKPLPIPASAEGAREFQLPARLTRVALADAQGHVYERHYGEGRSLAVWRRDEGSVRLVPRESLVVADLGDWSVHPISGTVAIDPERGRVAFAMDEAPERGLLVSYHYGFSDAMGGGEYVRPMSQRPAGSVTYIVGPEGDCGTLDEALQRWQTDKPADAVIELMVNEIYADPAPIALRENQRLEIRAADQTRPMIDLRNRQRDAREFMSVRGAVGSRLLLVGLLVAGRGLQIKGHLAELGIRHCTLVPGWEVSAGMGSDADMTPSIRLDNVTTRVVIEHSILGPVSVVSSVPEQEPLELWITDSIVDATSTERRAIDGPERRAAKVRLTVARSTLIGRVHVSDLEQAQDSLLVGELDVARRQAGCMRHCYVESASHTPRLFMCQPDAATAGSRGAQAQAIEARLKPRFNSLRYGSPRYCQLADECPLEITRGASDGSEMGVFHDLHEAQRLANLQARLDEYVPAGCDVGIVKET